MTSLIQLPWGRYILVIDVSDSFDNVGLVVSLTLIDVMNFSVLCRTFDGGSELSGIKMTSTSSLVG